MPANAASRAPAALPKPRPNWPAIRLAYVNQQGSLASLSKEFGVPLRTLERRCSREGWRRAVAATGGVVAAVAAEVAAEEGRRIGLDAAGLIARTLADASTWFARIETLANQPTVDPQALRHLVTSWRSVIETGRTALGLDVEEAPSRLSVTFINSQIDQAHPLIDLSASPTDVDASPSTPALAP